MEDDEGSTQPQLPMPWMALNKAYRARYQKTTGKAAPEVLVEVRNGIPVPVSFENPVLAGVARKASSKMARTCQSCGAAARRRSVDFGYKMRCAACHGKTELAEGIREVVAITTGTGNRRATNDLWVWHEHELSAHLRAALPASIWRSTKIPGLGSLRYFCREDVRRFSPWLLKLAALLEKED